MNTSDASSIASRRSWPRVLVQILLVVYLVALVLIVWLPSEEASRVTGIVLVFAKLMEALGASLSTAYAVLEFLANIALFVPFGVLLSLNWPQRSFWWVLASGLFSSITIELVQTMLPSRVPAVSDVVANTLGTAFGWVLVILAGVLLTRRRSTLDA